MLPKVYDGSNIKFFHIESTLESKIICHPIYENDVGRWPYCPLKKIMMRLLLLYKCESIIKYVMLNLALTNIIQYFDIRKN